MPKLEQEGNFSGQVTLAQIIQKRFSDNETDLEVKLTVDIGEGVFGEVYMPITHNYIQKGQHRGHKEGEVTCGQLATMGIDNGGSDSSFGISIPDPKAEAAVSRIRVRAVGRYSFMTGSFCLVLAISSRPWLNRDPGGKDSRMHHLANMLQ